MKKGVFILFLAICLLFAVSSVCASNVDDTAIASQNSSQILEEINEKPISSIDEINEGIISQETNDDGISGDLLNSGEIGDIEDLESSDEQSILSEPKTIYATTKTLQGIKNAIGSASDGDTIILDGAYDCPSVGWVTTLTIDKKLNFVGINDATLTRTGSGASGMYLPAFNVYVNDVSFKNIAFKDFYNKYSEDKEGHGGGAIHSANRLFVDNCTFTNCGSITGGGAICISSNSNHEDSSIINSKFIDCYSENGGAISIDSENGGGSVYIINSTFKNNHADNKGGAIYSDRGFTLSNCLFENCTANLGGGIYQWGSSIWISNLTFKDCFGENDTGAFGVTHVYLYSNCFFVNSTYTSYCGVDYVFDLSDVANDTFTSLQDKISNAEDSSTITLENDYIYDNVTYHYENQISQDGIVISKSLTIDGKGYKIDAKGKIRIFTIEPYHEITLKNLILINGYSNYGGGAIFANNAGLTVINCSFYNNEAENGSAIYSTNHLTITDSHFINNTARGYGGAIYDAGNYFDITNNVFSNNAANDGGAIYLDGGVEKASESAIVGFDARESGYYGYWYVAPTSGTDNKQVTYQNLIDAGIWNYLSDDRIGDRVRSLIDYYQSGNTGAMDYYVSTYCPEGSLWYTRDKLVPAGEGTIFKNIFTNNNATEKGGAIYSTANNIVIKENRFINNSAGDESIIYLSNKTQIREGIVGAEAFNKQYKSVDYIDFYIGERFKFHISFKFCELQDPKVTNYINGDIETVVGYNVSLSNNIFEQNNAETTGNVIINEGINTTFENNINNGEAIISDPSNPTNPTNPTNPIGPQNPSNPTNSTNADSQNSTNTNTQTSTTQKTTLTLKKVKVKKSAKKLVISATLKINGKAAKGKIIKFKFNKKTYKAKTNNEGVAKITIKKAVLNKLGVGKKVTYAATYNEITKKVAVKVKK